MLALPLAAQTRYVYFPSPRTDDGRFLTMAGAGLNTLGQEVVLKLGAARTSTTLEVGIFDGETGGRWDVGTLQMQYLLYADPNGDGSGNTLLAQWDGSQMPDNAWFTATITNPAAARSPIGDYFYRLVVHNPDLTVPNVWNNFKIRTSGTVVALLDRPVAYTAPMFSLADAQTICPQYPTLDPTTYDGSWNFYFYLRQPATSFTIWDGDMDFGSYDCSVNDDDDPDTPNDAVPTWAQGTMAVPEGVATSTQPCVNSSGVQTGGNTTSNPPDDSRNSATRRSPNVGYEVISPDGVHYANTNPSGNLEWEQFNLSTAPFDRNVMDYHADSLPAGVYQVKVVGVDLNNLNAFRFPLDALGVDSTGAPVLPISPDFSDGVVSGTIYYESGNNTTQDVGEAGIPSITINLAVDYNNDGVVDATLTTETDADGYFIFGGLSAGTYTLTVDLGTLADDVTPLTDPDGTATPSSSTFTLTMGSRTVVETFGYHRINDVGTRTRGYWVNHPTAWPATELRLGNTYYSKCQLIDILQRATRGDKTYALAAQLIAAKLNILDGCDPSCIEQTITDSDSWLVQHRLGSNVKSWCGGDVLQNTLDDYNNGRLCVGHMN
ncbi:MAG: hypothetical protein JST22_08275 [Bacteroidetes bacterium]|nr:hypothetical protein [Bacteroidota bacterium]